MVAWNTDVFTRKFPKKEGKAAAADGEIMVGRLVGAHLVAMACGSEMHVVGTYAPGRDGSAAEARSHGRKRARKEEEAQVDDFWTHIAERAADPTLVWAGDMNAWTGGHVEVGAPQQRWPRATPPERVLRG